MPLGSESSAKSCKLPANIADVSFLIFKVLIESMPFKTGMSSEAGAANFAVKRRLWIMHFGDVALQFAVSAGTKGAFIEEAMRSLHVVKGVFVLDFLFADAAWLQGRRLRHSVQTFRSSALSLEGD